MREGGQGDPKRVWRRLSSRAHKPLAQRKLRLSLQKPSRRANQRDEEAIERWKEERWPSIKKRH